MSRFTVIWKHKVEVVIWACSLEEHTYQNVEIKEIKGIIMVKSWNPIINPANESKILTSVSI